LRGYIAGTLGLPGDIEGLGRMLIPGVSEQSYLPDTEYFRKVLPMRELEQTPIGSAFTEAGGLAGGAGLMTAGKVVGKGGMAAGRAGERLAEKYVPQIMERGGAGADILSGMAKGSRSQVKPPQKKVAKQAPQEEALRLARQRAKAIGQSADPRTRMLQQGYDDSFYHGTTGDITSFRPDLRGETTGAQSAKKGFFFARDPLNPPEAMLKRTNDPAAGDLLRKIGISEDEIAKLNTVSMEGHGPDTASGYASIGGSREYKEAMREAKAAEKRGDWPEYERQMQLAEDSEITRMQYGQNVVAKYGDARDEMLEKIKNVWYGPQNADQFKNMSQADYEAYDKKFKELMPYGWYNSYSNAQLNALKKELVKTVGDDTAQSALDTINKFQSVRNERALIEKTQEGGNVMPVALRYENPMVYDFEGKPYRDQSYSDLVDQAVSSGNDALILKNTYDPGGGPSKLVDVGVVFDPDQIRSRFAAFDPLRKTAATAAAAGLASPDLLAEENKAAGGPVSLNQLVARYDKGGDVDESKAAFGIYPKQRATPSSKETKEAMAEAAQFASEMLIPQTPFDAGLMLIPGGKIARKAGAALIALDAGDAQAGPLTKLLKAFHGASRPIEGTYDVSKASERSIMGRGLNVSTDPAYPSKWAMHPGSLAPTVYETGVPVDKYIQLDAKYPQEAFDVLRKVRGRNPLPEGEVTGEQVYQSLRGLPQSMIPDVVLKSGYKGIEYPAQDKGRWFSIYDTEGVKDRLGKKFADGGPASLEQLAAHYDKGGAVKAGIKKIISLFDDGEEVALTAAQRAEAGRKAAELIKAQEQIKASEALGQLMERGTKRTTTTQSDRTRVGGGNIGGAAFPAISQADPAYAGKVWGVMDEGTAARLKNLTSPDTAWTTMLGAANQLKSNPIVFDKLKRGFLDSMKKGNLSDDLAGRINQNLALTFGEGADIRNPKIWREADTFEKRAALADVMMGQGVAPGKGGIALGGEKSGKGVIFRPTDILKRETEPLLLHSEYGGGVPTYAAGPRLFKIGKESEYRPDLHPGFPTLLRGEDLGINMMPTPTEVYLPDWHAKFKKANPDRAPGYYDLSLGVKGEGLPSQEINDAYIRHLMREGYAEGGSVNSPATYDPSLIDEIVSSIDEPTGYAGGGEVNAPDMEFKEDPEALRLYKYAMKQAMPNTEDSMSSTGAGARARVAGGDFSAGIDMNRMTQGQQDRLMKSLAANYNVNLGDVNLNTRLEMPLDAKDVYVGMLNGSIPLGVGRAMLGVQGVKTPYGSDVLGYNVGYSGKVGPGLLSTNVNIPKQGKASGQVRYQIPFAEGGSVSAYDADLVDAIANQFM
jgi:hypothetical protein